VVNGCQSLSTILSCSEQVKKLSDTHVMFRFYEIPQHDRAEKISTSTNSQSTVKPRDLRSNDKRVLALKKAYEQRYPDGMFLTKRGEQAPAGKDQNKVVEMVSLGKRLMSWQSQRPNIAYSETKIFDKYFEQIFKRDYSPERVLALHEWMRLIDGKWTKDNPLGFNETLLAMKAYAPHHHLFAVSAFFSVGSNKPDRVPAPDAALERAKDRNIVDWVVNFAGKALNMALTNAANEPLPGNRVFSPANWVKAKSSLTGITNVVQTQLMMLPDMGAKQQCEALVLPPESFEYRWQAD
jgi:hypothetical protein